MLLPGIKKEIMMNKNLILKGEMRVMTFGKNPSEGVLVYGFTSLEAVEYEGENIIGKLGETKEPFLYHPNTSYLETEDLHVTAVSDIGYVELPVVLLECDDDDWSRWHLSCDTHRTFEGASRLYMAQEITYTENVSYFLVASEEDVLRILDLADIDKSWVEVKDRFPEELPEPVMLHADSMTTITAGDNEVNVPTGFAQEVKHFINQFRLKVVDLIMIIRYEEHTSTWVLCLFIEPTSVTRTRHYKNLELELARKTIKEYNIDVWFHVNDDDE